MYLYLSWLMIASVLGFTQLFAVGGFGVTPLEFSLSGVFLIAAYRWIWLGEPIHLPRTAVTGALVAMISVVTLSTGIVAATGNTAMVSQALKSYVHFVYLWCVGITFYTLEIPASTWVRALRVHLVVAGIIMIYGLYQLPARAFDWPLAWIEITNVSFTRGLAEETDFGQIALRFANFYRATSIFSEPSALSGYATATLVMLIVPYFRGGPSLVQRRWWFWTLVVLATLSIFLAFSITGLLLLGATATVISILYPRAAIRKLLVVGAVVLAFLGVTDRVVEATTEISVFELFGQRLSSYATGAAAEDELGTLSGDSFSQRLLDYETAVIAWEEAPLTGVGPGNFSNSDIGRHYSQPFLSTLIGSVLVEFGLIGFVAIGAALISLFLNALFVERQWTTGHRGEQSDEERIAPFLPFRWLLIVLTAVTGNFLITPWFWMEAALLCTAQAAVQRRMGTLKTTALHVVAEPWLQRWQRSRSKV